jgi:hypothetical protein
MNTATTTAPTFAEAMTASRFFARNIEAIKISLAPADYIWNARGQQLAEASVRQALRLQMIPATRANVTAALAYVAEGK